MNIADFCDSWSTRIYLSRPFILLDRVVASNGDIFATCPAVDGFEQCPNPYITKFLPLMDKLSRTLYFPAPSGLKMPEAEKCHYCDGSGKSLRIECAECDGEGAVKWNSGFNDYETHCLSCYGDGEIIVTKTDQECFGCRGSGWSYAHGSYVNIHGIPVNPAYLRLIIDEPDLMIAPDPVKKQLAFKSGDCLGLISGMVL